MLSDLCLIFRHSDDRLNQKNMCVSTWRTDVKPVHQNWNLCVTQLQLCVIGDNAMSWKLSSLTPQNFLAESPDQSSLSEYKEHFPFLFCCQHTSPKQASSLTSASCSSAEFAPIRSGEVILLSKTCATMACLSRAGIDCSPAISRRFKPASLSSSVRSKEQSRVQTLACLTHTTGSTLLQKGYQVLPQFQLVSQLVGALSPVNH